jgi:phosphoglycerol transferase
LLGYLLCAALNLLRREKTTGPDLLSHLSVLNISAVLLGTIGGFGALFALLISPQIRAYNRISVYIAFFAFFTVVLLLHRARQKFFRARGLRLAFDVLVVALMILGLLDQNPRRFVPQYAGVKSEFLNDAEFVKRIEASVPRAAMIFQLPVKQFPETGPIERVTDYDLFKGYLHSKELRWSYAAMRGRPSDTWQSAVIAKPLPEMVESVALSNFEGIYIDRFGYADNGSKLESELATLLETKPIVSKNERLSFFNLAAYQTKLQARYPEQQLALKREQALYPLTTTWEGDFSVLEGKPGAEWRWCGRTGELVLYNMASHPRVVTVEMSVASGAGGHVRIESQFFAEQLKAYPESQPFSKTFEVPPGQHRLKFSSDAQAVYAPTDPRVMVFRLINFKLKSD